MELQKSDDALETIEVTKPECLTETREIFLFKELLIEVEATDWSQDDKERVYAAMAVAERAHEGQMRAYGKPHLQHPLRVAIRMLRDIGVRDDPNIVIACLLHDAPEDRPERLVEILTGHPPSIPNAQLEAFRYTEVVFGKDPANLVEAVTKKPYGANDVSQDEKIAIYESSVISLAHANPRAMLIKIADYLDNSLALSGHEGFAPAARENEKAHAKKLGKKYRTVHAFFKKWIEETDRINPQAKRTLLSQLNECATNYDKADALTLAPVNSVYGKIAA
jgi:(p)ppGpp synthase/HD superfamily hydrolase